MKKFEIVFVSLPFSSARGGAENAILKLAQFFESRKSRVALFTASKILRNIFRENKISARKIWFEKINPVSRISLLFFPIFAPALILIAFFLTAFCKIRGARKIFLHHFQEKIFFSFFAQLFHLEIFCVEHELFRDSILRNPLFGIFKFATRNATFLTPSQFLKTEILKNLPRAKIEVLPNFVDDFKSMNNGFKPIVAPQNTHKNFIVGFCGRFAAEKNISEILQIAAILRDEKVEFHLAGTGELFAKIKNEIATQNLKNVFLRGFLGKKNLKKFYKKIDAFVLFSKFETFGIAVAENCAAGNPAFLADIPPFREIADENCAEFFDEKNRAKKVAARILFLRENPQILQKMKNAARTNFERKFTREKVEKIAARLFQI